MTTQQNEQLLIERAKAYDEDALQSIYEQHAAGIFRYLYYRVGNHETAEDLRAEVFLKMLEGIEGFEYKGWSISAWLYRIAHDRLVDHLRRSQRRQHAPLNECLADPAAGPEYLSLQRFDHEALHAALKQLTDDQAEIITLRFIAGQSIKEVARITGRSEGSIKALQHRALQSLARLLGSQV